MACSSIWKIIVKTSKFWPTVFATDENGVDVKEHVRLAIEGLPAESLKPGAMFHFTYRQKEAVNVGEYPIEDLIHGKNSCFLGRLKDGKTRLFAAAEDLREGIVKSNKIYVTFIVDETSGANTIKVISAVPVRDDDDEKEEKGNGRSFKIIQFWDDPDKFHNNYAAQKAAYVERGVVLAVTKEEREKYVKLPFSGEKAYDEKGVQILLTLKIPDEDKKFWQFDTKNEEEEAAV